MPGKSGAGGNGIVAGGAGDKFRSGELLVSNRATGPEHFGVYRYGLKIAACDYNKPKNIVSNCRLMPGKTLDDLINAQISAKRHH